MVQVSRAATGIPGFDSLLQGGIPKGNVLILAGHAGVGKTTFCAQFLAHGCSRGEKGLYVSFSEVKTKLLRNANQFGFDLKEWEEKGLLRTEFVSLEGQNAVQSAMDGMMKSIEEFHPLRLVIDSASSLALVMPGTRTDVTMMLQSLFSKLGSYEECTTILVAEMSSGTEQFGTGIEEFISDGIVLLRFRSRGKTRVRSLEVRKMRGAPHSAKSVLFEINENGIEVDPEIELT